MLTEIQRKARNARVTKWRRRHREKHNAYQRALRAKNIEKYRMRIRRDRAMYPWRSIAYTLRYVSRKRKIAFTITMEEVKKLWTGKCAVTGLRFKRTTKPGPLSASLDRINPRKGYINGNCRFVCFGYNMLKGIGTDALALKIAKAVLKGQP